MRLSLLLAVVLPALACADPLAPALAGVPRPSFDATVSRSTLTIPLVDLATPNDCTGEVIVFNGELVLRVQSVTDATGGTHMQFLTRAHASGVSASGVRYIAIDAEHLTSDDPSGACNTAAGCTGIAVIKFVAQGSVADLTLRSLVHFSQNAAGDLVARVERSEASCR